MNADKLVRLVTELCDNVRDGLLSPTTAADAIASAATAYEPEVHVVTEQESRQAAADMLASLEMPEVSIERVLDAAKAQGEVMTVLEYGNARVEYRAGVYTVTP
jgi:hypothetical protein